MPNLGDRVSLLIDNPDDNEDLWRGEEGEIVRLPTLTSFCYLVKWDAYSESAESNDHYIETFYDSSAPEEGEWEEIYSEFSGRLWFVHPNEFEVINNKTIPFRDKKLHESLLEYKIARKIAQLDYKWKEKQLAKTNNLSL